MKVRNPTAHHAPGLLAIVVAFGGAIYAEIVSVLDRRFGAQNTTDLCERFVVQLDRVPVNGVFDPDSFLTLFDGADPLSRKVPEYPPVEPHPFAEVAHHLAPTQTRHPVMDHPWTHPAHGSRFTQHDTNGPHPLGRGPQRSP